MILITGAPRNGLSLIAYYFVQLGMATTIESFSDNNFVDPIIAAINNDILKSSGCAWCNAPNGTQFKADGSIKYRIAQFMNHNDDIDFLVDSRFTFTYPIWQRIAKEIDIIVTFREPGEASKSFRNEFGGFVCEAITVWSQHYTRLASTNAAFVEFGANIDFIDYEENVGRAMRWLDLDHKSGILEKCYNPKLFHQNESTSLYPPIIKLYDLLKSRKEN